MKFHAGLAEAAGAPTEFRLLNSSAPILVGTGNDNGISYQRIMDVLNNNSPGGGTPLCRHIAEVTAQIIQMAPQLRFNLSPYHLHRTSYQHNIFMCDIELYIITKPILS